MDGLMGTGSTIANGVGAWVAFLVTLMIFSALAGENAVSRLAQHILIGAGLGYAGVLALRNVFAPRIIAPILSGNATIASAWIPLALCLVLVVAATDRVIFQSIDRSGQISVPRRALHGAGRLVVALLLGIGLGAGLMGALQGTFIPQYLRAAQTGFAPSAAGYGPLVGVLLLLLTTSTLLHLFVDPDRHLTQQPRYARGFVQGWLWIGQRALWFAAGLVFARLIASRLSLLIARVMFLAQVINDSALWRWLESL